MHSEPHWYISFCSARSRDLRTGPRGESEPHLARHAAHRRAHGEARQLESRRLADERHRTQRYYTRIIFSILLIRFPFAYVLNGFCYCCAYSEPLVRLRTYGRCGHGPIGTHVDRRRTPAVLRDPSARYEQVTRYYSSTPLISIKNISSLFPASIFLPLSFIRTKKSSFHVTRPCYVTHKSLPFKTNESNWLNLRRAHFL